MRTHVVGSNEHHLTFESWFRRRLAATVPGTAAAAVAAGRFSLNGVPLSDPHAILSAGDAIVDRDGADRIVRPAASLSVVFEDPDLLVVDKPAGMLSHPERGMREPDILSALASFRDAAGCAPGNRLDFNTGGLLIVTRSSVAAGMLAAAMRENRIVKKYLAVVSGYMVEPEAVLSAWLLKDDVASVVRVADVPIPGSKPIKTAYRVLEERQGLSLLEIEPITGRTHQIRAHFAFVGHPVVGDALYGHPGVNRRYGMKRQALCSRSLSFSFPEPDHPWHRLDGRILVKKDVDFLDPLGFGTK
ncbi:MAG: RluA family pseudouridine synthase [Candidatus Izemoplasmatales bacterium]